MKRNEVEEYYAANNIKKHKIVSVYARGRVLDLGFASCPNPFLNDIEGLDLVIDEKPKNYAKVIKHDLNDGRLPYEDESFDTVLACDVIEHLDNPANIIKESKRILKNEGVLIITIPNPYSLNEIIINITGLYRKERWRDRSHKQSFTHNNIANLLEDNDFRIVGIRGFRIKIPFTDFAIINKHIPALISTQVIYINKVGGQKYE